MSKRTWLTVPLVLALAAGCSKKAEDAPKASEKPAKTPAKTPVDAPVQAKIDGARVVPVVAGHAVVFAAPGGDAWWLAGSMACYSAAVNAGGPGTGMSLGQMMAMQNPGAPAALREAGVDLDRDLVGFGAFSCGKEPCMYAAVNARSPEKLGAALGAAGAGEPVAVDAMHHTITTNGVNGPRTVHLQAVPIDWSGVTLPDDDWAADARRANYVVFLYGVNAGEETPDPLKVLASGAAAGARLGQALELVSDDRGVCLLGSLAPDEDLEPGARIKTARFALVAPPRGPSDVAAAAMGSPRTIDLQIELGFAAPITRTQVERWVDQAREFVRQTAGPLMPQLEGSLGRDVVTAMATIGEAGFEWKIDGANLRLSWTTRNVSSAELNQAGSGLGGF